MATKKKNAPKKNASRKGGKDNPLQPGELDDILEQDPEKREYKIVKATIVDQICDYTYQVTEGLGEGDKHKVDGSGIVKDSLLEAMAKFRVHLAWSDGVFRLANIDVTNIDKFHNHEYTDLYHVNGIEITGTEECEFIKIIGNKFMQEAGGRMEMKTPKIAMDELSSYHWHTELREAAEGVREEVALYKEGNYTPVEKPEKDDKVKQLTIADQEGHHEDNIGNHEDDDNNGEGEGSGEGTRKPTASELMEGKETDKNGQVADEEFTKNEM